MCGEIMLLYLCALFTYLPAHRKSNKKEETSGTTEEEAGRVVYVGHIPHGFYEEAMKGFFSQFGGLKRCRLSRSKRSARSKGYAFLEFEDSATACIVADAMDGYFIYDKQLVCNVIPPRKVHPSMFKGSDKRFKVIDWHMKHREEFNQPRNESQHVKNLLKSEAKKRRKLAAMGIDYVFKGFKEEREELKGKQEGQKGERQKKKQKKNDGTKEASVEAVVSKVRVAKKKRSQEELKMSNMKQDGQPKKQLKSSKVSESKQVEKDSSQQQQLPIERKKRRKGMPPSPTAEPQRVTRRSTRSSSVKKEKVPSG